MRKAAYLGVFFEGRTELRHGRLGRAGKNAETLAPVRFNDVARRSDPAGRSDGESPPRRTRNWSKCSWQRNHLCFLLFAPFVTRPVTVRLCRTTVAVGLAEHRKSDPQSGSLIPPDRDSCIGKHGC